MIRTGNFRLGADKGSYLKQLVEKFLGNDGVQTPQYKDVWLWKDWPDRPGNFSAIDNGMNLAAARQRFNQAHGGVGEGS